MLFKFRCISKWTTVIWDLDAFVVSLFQQQRIFIYKETSVLWIWIYALSVCFLEEGSRCQCNWHISSGFWYRQLNSQFFEPLEIVEKMWSDNKIHFNPTICIIKFPRKLMDCLVSTHINTICNFVLRLFA